ncbi:alpha-1B adrenergic receptor-like [Patiria miniata]|uniref:G-protein coupled receptors family 1 profile domain-containing protein n=1 Tax=Patiria miniata TaxID=46514 RepID=A0A913YZC9_PATMI|nr:alpha-1B adrenergic receptor-like [Patiria miniata]
MAADSTNSTTFDNTDVYYSYLQRQIIAGVIGLVCILGIAGNTLVILAVALSRKLRHTTNYFVLNLSLADLLTCLFLPMAVVALLNDVWPLPDFLCIATGAVFVTCLTCSVNCLACVAFNRYILITKPKTLYRRLYTPRRTILAIILVWFVPLSVVIIAASTRYIKLGFDSQFSCCAWVISESDPGFYFVMFSSCCPLQFAVLSWSYGNIFYHVRKHAKAVAHMEGTSGESDTTGSNESRGNPPIQAAPRKQSSKLQIEVTKNLFCVVCVFLICTAPFGISLILGKNGLRLYPIGAALLCCNSCVNPIIYAAKHPQFRLVFKSILLCRFSDIPERVRFC